MNAKKLLRSCKKKRMVSNIENRDFLLVTLLFLLITVICVKTSLIIFLAAKSDKAPSSTNSRKFYDPNQFSEQSADSQALKEALNRIKLLEFDYRALHDKRLQDVSDYILCC